MNPLLHKKGDNFAIICFSADKGEILWQNWLDSEILTTSAISGNSVYTATMNGSLYKFDLETGSLQGRVEGKFNSPPTIANNKIYISEADGKIESTHIYDASSLKLLKASKPIPYKKPIERSGGLTSVQKMNHTGNQVTYYKGLAYKMEGNSVICYDSNSWSAKWSFSIDNTNNYDLFEDQDIKISPAAFNDMVMISSYSGKIYFLHYQTGKLIKKYDLGDPLFSQAIVHKGRIISGTAKGKVITIDTKDIQFDGWYMLNGSKKHNAAKE